jgi:hypothetical protein
MKLWSYGGLPEQAPEPPLQEDMGANEANDLLPGYPVLQDHNTGVQRRLLTNLLRFRKLGRVEAKWWLTTRGNLTTS